MLIMHQLEKDVDVQMHIHMCYYRRLILAFGLDNTEMGGGVELYIKYVNELASRKDRSMWAELRSLASFPCMGIWIFFFSIQMRCYLKKWQPPDTMLFIYLISYLVTT